MFKRGGGSSVPEETRETHGVLAGKRRQGDERRPTQRVVLCSSMWPLLRWGNTSSSVDSLE